MSENVLLDSASDEATEKQSKAEPGTMTVVQRKRGGQPGNQNALRHGFYAANLGQISPRQYDETEMRNLLGQAAMLKDYMYKLYTKNADSTDSNTIIESLRALSLAGVSIARVLQAPMTSASMAVKPTAPSTNCFPRSMLPPIWPNRLT